MLLNTYSTSILRRTGSLYAQRSFSESAPRRLRTIGCGRRPRPNSDKVDQSSHIPVRGWPKPANLGPNVAKVAYRRSPDARRLSPKLKHGKGLMIGEARVAKSKSPATFSVLGWSIAVPESCPHTFSGCEPTFAQIGATSAEVATILAETSPTCLHRLDLGPYRLKIDRSGPRLEASFLGARSLRWRWPPVVGG